jgi:hypothetical protein
MRSDYFGRVSSKGLENVSRFPSLFAELVRPGFYERDIAKIKCWASPPDALSEKRWVRINHLPLSGVK